MTRYVFVINVSCVSLFWLTDLFGDRKVIRPKKAYAAFPQTFSSETIGGRRPSGNWPNPG